MRNSKLQNGKANQRQNKEDEACFKISDRFLVKGEIMRKCILALFALCLFVTCSGCATVVTGKYQKIPVTSDPPGVKVRASSGEYVIAPGSFNLKRNEDHTLVAEYPGNEPQQVKLKHGLQGWFWGNILVGGIIGGVVDLASGSCDKLVPDSVHFDFTHAGRAVIDRRKAYLDANPETKEEIAFAISNGLSAKGMSRQELFASLGEHDRAMNSGELIVLVYEGRTPSSYYFKDDILVEAK